MSGHPYKDEEPYYKYVREEGMTRDDLLIPDSVLERKGLTLAQAYRWLAGWSGCPNCRTDEKVYYDHVWQSDTAKCPNCDLEINDPWNTGWKPSL